MRLALLLAPLAVSCGAATGPSTGTLSSSNAGRGAPAVPGACRGDTIDLDEAIAACGTGEERGPFEQGFVPEAELAATAVAPGVVAPGEAFTVEVRVVNDTAADLRFQWRTACADAGFAIRDAAGEPVDLDVGLCAHGCGYETGAITLEPGAALVRRVPATAIRRRGTEDCSLVPDAPLPPGDYVLRVWTRFATWEGPLQVR